MTFCAFKCELCIKANWVYDQTCGSFFFFFFQKLIRLQGPTRSLENYIFFYFKDEQEAWSAHLRHLQQSQSVESGARENGGWIISAGQIKTASALNSLLYSCLLVSKKIKKNTLWTKQRLQSLTLSKLSPKKWFRSPLESVTHLASKRNDLLRCCRADASTNAAFLRIILHFLALKRRKEVFKWCFNVERNSPEHHPDLFFHSSP